MLFSFPLSQVTAGAGNLGVLIPKIASLLETMKPISEPSVRARNLFRDFLFYCSVVGFNYKEMSGECGPGWASCSAAGLWPDEWYKAVCKVAVKAPVLTAVENLKSEMIENAAIKLESLPLSDLQDFRTALLKELQQTPELSTLVMRMDFAQCVYLLSVCRTERMRVLHSAEVDAPQQIFKYLEDK